MSTTKQIYSWCNRCGALVVGDINHGCDKCGNHDLSHFEVEVELVTLQARVDELEGQLAEHEWVSVEDRLPEEKESSVPWRSENVMVTDGTDWDVGFWRTRSGAKWDLYVRHDMKPTHWKPIHLPSSDTEKITPFLHECKWQVEGHRNTLCDSKSNKNYGQPCSRRCATSEPKEQ